MRLSLVTWLSLFGSDPHRESCPSILGGEPLSVLLELIWTPLKREEQSGQAQQQSTVMDFAWLISSKECPGGRVMWGSRKQTQAQHSHQLCELLRTSLFSGPQFPPLKKRCWRTVHVFRTFVNLKGSRTVIFLRGWVRKGTISNRWLHSAGH